jgi:branched-chain amino acid transport system permease protein
MTFRVRVLIGAIVLAALAYAPFVFGPAGQGVMTRMLIAALFATGYNLLLGQAGLLSFGHAAFYGAGAFATLHAMIGIERGAFYLPLPFLPLIGAGAGFVLALIAGFFATKRSGTYFALVTLAMAELIHVIAPMWQGVFGGEAGLTSMRMASFGVSFDSARHVYLLTLLWVAIGISLLWCLSQTAFGQLALALKGNEQRLKFLGFNTYQNKVLVFAISGTVAGLAGSLLSISTETANYTLLSAEVSTQVVFYAFIGGSAFFFGPAVAAAALVVLPYQLSNYTHAWPLYQGLFFMVVMLSTPHGIGGLLNSSAGAHRNSDRTKELARLLIGISIVGAIAVCVEVAMRIGGNAIKAVLVDGHNSLWILLAFIAAATLVLSRRILAAGRFVASKTTKSSHS